MMMSKMIISAMVAGAAVASEDSSFRATGMVNSTNVMMDATAHSTLASDRRPAGHGRDDWGKVSKPHFPAAGSVKQPWVTVIGGVGDKIRTLVEQCETVVPFDEGFSGKGVEGTVSSFAEAGAVPKSKPEPRCPQQSGGKNLVYCNPDEASFQCLSEKNEFDALEEQCVSGSISIEDIMLASSNRQDSKPTSRLQQEDVQTADRAFSGLTTCSVYFNADATTGVCFCVDPPQIM